MAVPLMKGVCHMVKLNLFEKLKIKRASVEGNHLAMSLRLWGKKRDRYIEKYRKTGLEKYELMARSCWDEYCRILDVLMYFDMDKTTA